MVIDVLAVLASFVVVFGLAVTLYGWFTLSLRWLYRAVSHDVLASWDIQLDRLSERERAHARAYPPVAVLEAMFAAPPHRRRRIRFA
jgi:hypothetical protein